MTDATVRGTKEIPVLNGDQTIASAPDPILSLFGMGICQQDQVNHGENG